MSNQWFKFYGGEYLSDPKIERLSPVERSCWVTLLCLASMTEDGVVEFLTIESLLNKSGIQFDPYHPEEWEKSLSVITKFQNMRMIDAREDGSIAITNWSKRQESYLSGYERVKKYRDKNPEYSTVENAKRRARLLKSNGSFTKNEWEELKKKNDFKCAICGKKEPSIKLTIDHIIPLSKGGDNSIQNIQPLCGACNSSKGNKSSDNISDNVSDNARIDKNRIDKNKKRVIDLPDWLDKTKWAEWIAYRKERGVTCTETTIKRQIKLLESYKDQHTEIIEKSITNGWQGLFPEKGKVSGIKVEKGKFDQIQSIKI